MFGSSLLPVVCRRAYLSYLCLFSYSPVKHILTIGVTLCVSYERHELLTLPDHIGSPPPRFWWGPRAHSFIFLWCAVFLCFVSLRPVSCLSNVASVSGLFIPGFLYR